MKNWFKKLWNTIWHWWTNTRFCKWVVGTRFWKWLTHTKLWRWIAENLKDWHTFVIFAIVYLVMTSEVWLFYLLGWIFHNGVLIGIASASLIFWNAPATPLLALCLAVTLLIKKIIDKIFHRRKDDRVCEKEQSN